MTADENRPHGSKSTDELLAIFHWLDQHLQELCTQHASIQEELRRRGVEAPAMPPIPVNAAAPISGLLEYQTPQAWPAAVGAIGDPYADAARHHALRFTLIIGGTFAAIAAAMSLLLLA